MAAQSRSSETEDQQQSGKTPSRKKRKSKKGSVPEVLNADLLAMGTLQGSILLYSVAKGDLVSEMTGGHTQVVRDLSWHVDSDSIFSCSEDRRIVHWTPSKGKIKSQFKLDTGPINAITALPDGKTILSAGKSIKWWDVEKREILKKFTGHASRILQLSLVCFSDEPVQKGYVVSAANGDRLVSIWQLDSSEKSALVSFRLSDEPASMRVSRPTSRNEKVRLSVLTRGGILHVFEHQLNGNVRKPLQPAVTLQMTLADKKTDPVPVPVLAAHLSEDSDRSLLIAYGDLLKVGFERLDQSSLQQHMCLVRSFSSTQSGNLDTRKVSKVKTPNVPKDAKMLDSSHMTGSQPSQLDPGDSGGRKSKKRKLDSSRGPGLNGEERQLPMEDRLSVLNLDTPSVSGVSGDVVAPKMDSMANLLLQGLHSRDATMLDRVFKLTNHGVIEKTVRNLPAKVVFVLLKELHRRIFESPEQSSILLFWLRSLLTHHTSYMSTCSELDVLLGSLYQLMDSRVTLFDKMSQLKGRLDLVVSQLDIKQQTAHPTRKALCIYQDESSDETDSYIDELLPSVSESDADNWETEEEAKSDDDRMGDDDEEEEDEDDDADDNSEDDDD